MLKFFKKCWNYLFGKKEETSNDNYFVPSGVYTYKVTVAGESDSDSETDLVTVNVPMVADPNFEFYSPQEGDQWSEEGNGKYCADELVEETLKKKKKVSKSKKSKKSKGKRK